MIKINKYQQIKVPGDIKAMKTLKKIIESKDSGPTSQLAKNKAPVETQEKSLLKRLQDQRSHTVKPRYHPVGNG